MDPDKKVDENWKEKTEKEKVEEKQTPQQEEIYHKPDFNFFITTMSMQAMIALGKLQNPVTQKIDKNLNQAMFIIDTLDMLQEKTKGNLDQKETDILESVVSDLKMMYAQESAA